MSLPGQPPVEEFVLTLFEIPISNEGRGNRIQLPSGKTCLYDTGRAYPDRGIV